MWPLLLSVSMAGTWMGADFVPSGRGDAAWVASEETGENLLAETNGLTRPPLTIWGGFGGDRHGWMFGISATQWTTTQYIGQQQTRSHRGAIRISADHRRAFRQQKPDTLIPWVHFGLFGTIPTAIERSSGYTSEEQEAMDTVAKTARQEIGGIGIRAGTGIEFGLTENIYPGVRYSIVTHQNRAASDEAGVSVHTMTWTEGAITIRFVL